MAAEAECDELTSPTKDTPAEDMTDQPLVNPESAVYICATRYLWLALLAKKKSGTVGEPIHTPVYILLRSSRGCVLKNSSSSSIRVFVIPARFKIDMFITARV